MKKIIQRNLPLDVQYVCTDKKYIPLVNSVGLGCDNCGKLISNIATVKSKNGTYNIGFDCLETILINNHLVDNFSKEDLEKVKSDINKCIRIGKYISESISNNKNINITGLHFNKPLYKSDPYLTFHWEIDNQKSRNNDYIKAKDVDFDFAIKTLRNIFPKLNIVTENEN